MPTDWQAGVLVFLRTVSEILTAGIAITAFSLLLYAVTMNLRDRVARYFAFILICTGIIFVAETLGSIESNPGALNIWLRMQWVGIVFLPAAYLHFSDALLATTGRPSRGRRRWAVRLTYLGSTVFLVGLPFSYLVGPVVNLNSSIPHLQPTIFTNLFLVFFVAVMAVSWINFVRAYFRTTTTASRRRMFYLITGALAPVLGAFPFLPYVPNFAVNHQFTFWGLSVLLNLLVGILLVVMAYAVAFFGVSWPERVVKVRLFKWIMRGPFTASVTLAAVTITRRSGEAFGSAYNTFVPIVMVGVILLCEFAITIFAPAAIRWLFYGKDKEEMELLHNLEDQLLTRNDLKQFFEMVLAAAKDLLQSQGAYIAALNQGGLELVVSTGKTIFSESSEADFSESRTDDISEKILQEITRSNGQDYFRWGDGYLFPLLNGASDRPELIGLLGISGISVNPLDQEQILAMETLVNRASFALQNRHIQDNIFLTLETLSPRVHFIQQLRAVGQYDQGSLLSDDDPVQTDNDLSTWVKDALSHYWGGPKLTENPLLKLRVVQAALEESGGNQANALRAILRRAIDRVKPEGERRFTAEWILYNILELKFLEGKKVREVALRLAMSEADLYRKQRIAVEAVARAIGEMEVQAAKEAKA